MIISYLLLEVYFRFLDASWTNKPFSLTLEELDSLVNHFPRKDIDKTIKNKFIDDESQQICYNSTLMCNDSNLKFSSKQHIDSQEFEKICPYLIKNTLNDECQKEHIDQTRLLVKTEPIKAWLFSIITSILVNICAANGFLFIAIMKERIFQKILLFLLSLAIGILMSNAILHLIPNALDIDPRKNPEIFNKFLFIVFGIYSFLIVEIILKTVSSWSKNSVPKLDGPCLHEHSSHLPDPEHSSGRQSNSAVSKSTNNHAFYKPVFMSHAVSSSAFLILLGDLLHNFIDGMVIGSSYAISTRNGISVSVAIFCEEFAHELGDFAALLNSGMTKYQALFWNMVATSSNLIGAIIGVWIGANYNIVTIIESYCAGMFLYISLVVMLPDVLTKVTNLSKGRRKIYLKNVLLATFGILVGILTMVAMAYGQAYLSP